MDFDILPNVGVQYYHETLSKIPACPKDRLTLNYLSLYGQEARGQTAVTQMALLHTSRLSATPVAAPTFSSVHSSMSFSQVLADLSLPLFPGVMSWVMVFSRLLCLVWPKYLIFLLLICCRSMDFVFTCSRIQLLVICALFLTHGAVSWL